MSWAQIKKSVNSNLMKPLDTLIQEYAAPAASALSNSIWTEARAKYLDYLANGTYGLSALNTKITALQSKVYDKQFYKVEVKNITSTVTVLNITGPAELKLLSYYQSTSNSSYSTTSVMLTITIDGVTLSLDDSNCPRITNCYVGLGTNLTSSQEVKYLDLKCKKSLVVQAQLSNPGTVRSLRVTGYYSK